MRKYFFQRLWERLFRRESSAEEEDWQTLYAMDVDQAQSLSEPCENEECLLEGQAVDSFSTTTNLESDFSCVYQHWESLSAREQEVTALLCLDFSTNQIANRLYLSPTTVKTHVRNILLKFSLNSREELRLALSDWDFHEWA